MPLTRLNNTAKVNTAADVTDVSPVAGKTAAITAEKTATAKKTTIAEKSNADQTAENMFAVPATHGLPLTAAIDSTAVIRSLPVTTTTAAPISHSIVDVAPSLAAFETAAQNLSGSASASCGSTSPSNLTDESSQLEERLKILKLRREIAELESQGHYEPQMPRIRFEELDAAVPKFSGDDHRDVNKWFIQLEDYVEANNLSERHKCLALRRCVTGTAKECVFNYGLTDYGSLKTLMQTMFHRAVTRQEIYRQLRSRRLKSSESCIAYVVTMQSIASKMDIDETELVDIIIDGIPDSSNNISVLYGANSIKELIRRMDRYEQRRSSFSVPRSAAQSVARNVVPKPATAVSGKLTTVRCYNCSQFGHYQSSCPKPTRPPGSCFSCHQMGHQHSNCPKKKNRLTQVAAASEEIPNDDDYVDVRQWSD